MLLLGKAYTNITNVYPIEETETRYVWTEDKSFSKYVDPSWIGMTKEGNKPIAINEQLPLDAFDKYARSLYGTSKVAADLYCQEYYQAFNVPTVVNRMSCIYGYYQKDKIKHGLAGLSGK